MCGCVDMQICRCAGVQSISLALPSPTRDASPPLVFEFCVWVLLSLVQNGKLVEMQIYKYTKDVQMIIAIYIICTSYR